METILDRARREFGEYAKNAPYVPIRVVSYVAELESRIRVLEKLNIDLLVENSELKNDKR